MCSEWVRSIMKSSYSASLYHIKRANELCPFTSQIHLSDLNKSFVVTYLIMRNVFDIKISSEIIILFSFERNFAIKLVQTVTVIVTELRNSHWVNHQMRRYTRFTASK
jgi:hypothetical protein